jgi:hypothetical protein
MNVHDLIAHFKQLKANDDLIASKLEETIKIGNDNFTVHADAIKQTQEAVGGLLDAIIKIQQNLDEKDKRIKELEGCLAEKILLTT